MKKSLLFLLSAIVLFGESTNAQTIDTLGHFKFDGNFDNQAIGTNLVLATDTDELILENGYLKLINPAAHLIAFNLNTSNANKLVVESRGYYIKHDNFTINGFTFLDNQNHAIHLAHNFYHFSGTDEAGQYTYREHVFLNNVLLGPNNTGVEDYQVSELLDLSFDQWITEKIIIDYEAAIVTYIRLIEDELTLDTIDINPLIFNRSDSTEILISTFDWGANAELRLDELVISLESINDDICDLPNACCDPSIITGISCLFFFDPVCGCDEITYSNSCFANEAGIAAFTPGECGVTNTCNASDLPWLTEIINSADCTNNLCDLYAYQHTMNGNTVIDIWGYAACNLTVVPQHAVYACDGTFLFNYENLEFPLYFSETTLIFSCQDTPPWEIMECNSLNTQTIVLDRLNDRFDADIFGSPLTTEDWIGVFYSDDQGGQHCQAVVHYPGEAESLAMITCIDDPSTPEKDGFMVGENYTFRIQKSGGGEHLDLQAEFWPVGAFGFVPSAEETFVGQVKKSYLKSLKKQIDLGETDCSNPIDISCGTELSNLSNDTGNDSGVNLFCDSDNYVNGPEIYFKFVQTQLSDVKIAITNLQNDLELYVLNSNCNPFNCITKSENQETESEVLLLRNLAIGEYYIVVDGYIDATSTFDLEVICGDFGGGSNGENPEIDPDDGTSTADCPLELTCNNSIVCTTGARENHVYSYGCTPTRFNGGGEKIFTFVSPETKWVYISMTPEAGHNLDLFVLKGLNPQTDCINYSIEDGDETEGFFLYALANKEYYIIVDGFDEDEGAFTLSVGSCFDPIGGDDPGNPLPPISLNCENLDEVFCGIPYHGSNENGVSNYSGWGHCSGRSNTGKEILLEFNNPVHQQVLFFLTNMDENLNLYILDACNPQGCLGQGGTKGRTRFDNEDEAVLIAGLNAGKYYIVIDGVKNAESDFELYIQCDSSSLKCLDIPLSPGGTNYISTNLLPPNRSFKTIVDRFEGVIASVSDARGNAYAVGLGDPCNQNCPQTWEDLNAFAVILKPNIIVDTFITMCGAPTDTNAILNLAGYNPLNNESVKSNYLGYPFHVEQSVSQAFANVANMEELNLLVLKTPFEAQYYDFAAPNSNDFMMQPGQGFILYSFIDRDFSYRSGEIEYRQNGCELFKMPWFGSYNLSHAYLSSEILKQYMEAGDELAMLNEKGEVVASLLYRGENETIVLQGDMESTEIIEGYLQNEKISIRIYHHKSQQFSEYVPTFLNDLSTFNEGKLYQLESLKQPKVTNKILDEIKIFPNPTTDIITIVGPFEKDSKIKLYSPDNSVIQERTVSNPQETRIDVHHLPSGVYILSIQTKTSIYTKKCIKL